MSQKPLRIGIIGAGAVTTGSHLPALGAIPDITISWICDRARPAAERAAAKYGIKDVQSDLAACSDVDVVLMATPVGTREALIPAVLERGWSVFCEKPFALTTADHDRFVELAAQRGCHLGVAQVRRFAGATATARALVSSGVFGEIRRISAIEGMQVHNTGRGSDWHLTDTSMNTGVLMETGSHLVDQLLYIVDAKESQVTTATQIVRRSIELESEVAATVVLRDGRTVPALVALSMVRDLCNGVFIEFEKALMQVGVFFGDKLSLIDSSGRQICVIEQNLGINDAAASFAVEWVDFLQQVRGKRLSTVDASTVRRTTQFIHDAYSLATATGTAT
jgi:predicted dehydrogenase